MAKAPCILDEETRALLTRAAQAAGIEIVEWVGGQANVNMDGGHYGWNPMAKWGTGEALTLAVKLRLGLIPLDGGGWDVERFDERGNSQTLASCANGGAWALQEAIVIAAAKLAPAGAAGRAVGVPPCGESPCPAGQSCNSPDCRSGPQRTPWNTAPTTYGVKEAGSQVNDAHPPIDSEPTK